MKMITLMCALAIMACGTPKRPTAKPTASTTFRLGAEAPHVAFDAPGWHLTPGEATDQVILHWHDHRVDRGMALWIKDADPGDTVEAAMTKFAVMILSAPVLFKDAEAAATEVISDEEITFAMRGVDRKKGTRMLGLCRVKLVSGLGTAKWAMIFTYSAETDGPQMVLEAARIAKSLRIEAQASPK